MISVVPDERRTNENRIVRSLWQGSRWETCFRAGGGKQTWRDWVVGIQQRES